MFDSIKQYIYGSSLLKYIDIQIDITSKCNLSCQYCYNSSKSSGQEISLIQLEIILNQYKELLKSINMKPSIILSGGDPFLHSDLESILQTISKYYPSLPISILTNGTTFQVNDSFVSLLKKFNCSLQISIDGYDSNTHDQVRGVGTFDKIITNSKSLIDHKIPLAFQVVLSNSTSNMIDQLFRLASDLKMSGLCFTRLIGQPNNESSHDIRADELKKAYEQIVFASNEYNISTSTNLPLMTLVNSKLGMNHRAGMHAIIVDHNGDVRPTSRVDFVIGNIFKTNKTIKKLFLSDTTMKRLRSREINVCGKCDHFRMCGGDRNASYAKYGNFFEKDPGCWI